LGSVLIPLRRRQSKDSRDFPEIPDFPETPEKSLEYPGFTDKIFLSGDFQDSSIHPPPLGDIKILSMGYWKLQGPNRKMRRSSPSSGSWRIDRGSSWASVSPGLRWPRVSIESRNGERGTRAGT
jgi:hypothetical protein